MADHDNAILTIGHSTLSYERFLALLRKAGVTAIADVRSTPYSRRYPHFTGETLSQELRADGVSYAFLGVELGGRPTDPRFYCDGIADYEQMAASDSFQGGLKRIIDGSARHVIALMCSEHNPLDCHRCLLVGRALAERGRPVAHIMSNGTLAAQDQVEATLLKMTGDTHENLFASDGVRLNDAYRSRSRKVAFSKRRSIPAAAE